MLSASILCSVSAALLSKVLLSVASLLCSYSATFKSIISVVNSFTSSPIIDVVTSFMGAGAVAIGVLSTSLFFDVDNASSEFTTSILFCCGRAFPVLYL